MTTLILSITLLVSLAGMIIIIYRKLPLLIELPLDSREGVLLRVKETIKEKDWSEVFNTRNFLRKTLMRIRILNLKSENMINKKLEEWRHREIERPSHEDNYWSKLKDLTQKKK